MTSPGSRSIPELFSDAVGQLGKLIANEFELARAELSEKASQAGRAAGLIGAGAIFMIPALVLMLMAIAALLISGGFSAAAAYFLTGAGAALVSGALIAMGLSRLSSDALKPTMTLEQVERDKIAAKEMVRMNDISSKAGGFVHDLGEAARQNPLSAALIGMGVLWLFTNGRNAERLGELAGRSGFDRIPDAAADALDAARSSLRSGADSIGGRAASAGESLRDTATDYARAIPGSGVELYDTVRSNLTDVFKAQPLALGAIGLAIGAGMAAALPRTEVEGAYLGESSDALKTKATEFASEQADRATKVAGAVLDTVSEEARRQGLTLEDAKSAAGDISAKVVRVFDAASKAVSKNVSQHPID